jgi:hypothetical protein
MTIFDYTGKILIIGCIVEYHALDVAIAFFFTVTGKFYRLAFTMMLA